MCRQLLVATIWGPALSIIPKIERLCKKMQKNEFFFAISEHHVKKVCFHKKKCMVLLTSIFCCFSSSVPIFVCIILIYFLFAITFGNHDIQPTWVTC